jgi:TolB-like protein/class 3 adenylate cyclase/Tfp pilus assembly protein PilF
MPPVSTEIKKEIELEIAHVLFIDIVGYSKLVVDKQRHLLELINQIVRGTAQFRKAEATHRLITIPTGDGMALVFYSTPEAPVECALEISRAAQEHPELELRMGVHSGAVSGVIDVSGRANIAGAGINIAQRVMDCGDAGHILVSKHIAEDLEQLGHWKTRLHDLGDIEVKHGARVSVANLYTEELGNPEVPQKFLQARHKGASVPVAAEKPRGSRNWIIAAALALIAVFAVGEYLFSRRSAPVVSSGAAAPTPVTTHTVGATAAPVASTVSEKSIAVLPFDNLSDEKANAYFTDGVQDEILTDLAKVADLKVISRSSVMHYKSGVARDLRKIGQELGVAHLVEGSVQRVANRVRVNAQLIDARNDVHLWAQTYDRDLADVFAIQSEIAKAIADQLQAKLSPAEKNAIRERPTADVVAFEQYSKAKTLILAIGAGGTTERDYRQAIELLKSAITRDPDFHAAYCQLVLANDRLYALYDHTPARLQAAEAALSSAAQLRPDSAETHLARAQHLYFALRDYKGALAELDIAGRGLPNDARIPELTGYIVRRQGKHEEGLRALQQAVTLDPRNASVLQQISASYLNVSRYAEAAGVLDRALQIRPDDVALGAIRAQVDLFWHANPDPMCQYVERVRMERPESITSVADNWFQCAFVRRDWDSAEQALIALGDNPFSVDGPVQLSRQFGEALITRAKHDEARAREILTAVRTAQEQIVQQQKDYGPAICVLGLIDAALGNKDLAMQEGRRAIELLPVTKDALNGQTLIGYFAMIAAWAGEKDLALQQLNAAIRLPGGGFSITSYGGLKLLPFWDPLRGDPRFEQIVASLVPKD